MKQTPLPSPRSPGELDEKILAYAKQRAPDKKPFRHPLWLSGLATASVVVVAVLLALPEQAPISTPAAIPARVLPAPMQTSSDMALVAKPKAKLERSRKQLAPQMAMEAGAMMVEREMAMSDTGAEFNRAQIVEQLQQFATLLNNNEADQATEQYRAMRDACLTCELPLTLEKAIEKYLPDN